MVYSRIWILNSKNVYYITIVQNAVQWVLCQLAYVLVGSCFTSFDRLVPAIKYKYDKSLLTTKKVCMGEREKHEVKDAVMCRNHASGINGLVVSG